MVIIPRNTVCIFRILKPDNPKQGFGDFLQHYSDENCDIKRSQPYYYRGTVLA